MTIEDDDDGRAYAVGYGKPPKKSQFKPGQSGNPKGRRKAGNDVTPLDLMRILSEPRNVSVGGKVIKMPISEVVVRKFLEKAAQGDPRSLNVMLTLFREHGVIGKPDAAPMFDLEAAKRKLIEKFARYVPPKADVKE